MNTQPTTVKDISDFTEVTREDLEAQIALIRTEIEPLLAEISKVEIEIANRFPVAESSYVGEIGETLVLTLRFDDTRGYEGRFGFCHILEFTEGGGNIVTCFSKKSPTDLGIRLGEHYPIECKITKHRVFRNQFQTSINGKLKVL